MMTETMVSTELLARQEVLVQSHVTERAEHAERIARLEAEHARPAGTSERRPVVGDPWGRP